jgi:hypothetical protein
MSAKTVKIQFRHQYNGASFPGRWCEPIGWIPSNTIPGAEWEDGVYWDEDNEIAGLAWVGNPLEYDSQDITHVPLSSLRIVRTSGETVSKSVKVKSE